MGKCHGGGGSTHVAVVVVVAVPSTEGSTTVVVALVVVAAGQVLAVAGPVSLLLLDERAEAAPAVAAAGLGELLEAFRLGHTWPNGEVRKHPKEARRM